MPQMIIGQQYPIVSGPPKWDLAVALLEGSIERGTKKTISFEVEGIGTVRAYILGIKGEEFNLDGDEWDFNGFEQRRTLLMRIHGHFNVKTGSGHITAVLG